MKKILLSTLFTASILAYSQKLSDFKFVTPVHETENHYIVLPVKADDPTYKLGFMYFDEVAGYTFDYMGELYEDGGNLKFKPRKDAKTSFMKVRVENLSFKTALVSEDILKQINLPLQPDWLKNYMSSASANDKTLRRASVMNGANAPQLALPRLLELYKNNFRTESLYFELVFSYNAMNRFAEAEQIADEALKANKANDLVKKEYIYSLGNQSKVKKADEFLTKNLASFKNESNKIEAMVNLVASSAHNNNLVTAEKWLKELKAQPGISRYQRNITQLESIIKDKQSKNQ